MALLVITEHDSASLEGSTLNTANAAARCGREVDILIAGHRYRAALEAAEKIAGVTKVRVAEIAKFSDRLVEYIAALAPPLPLLGVTCTSWRRQWPTERTSCRGWPIWTLMEWTPSRIKAFEFLAEREIGSILLGIWSHRLIARISKRIAVSRRQFALVRSSGIAELLTSDLYEPNHMGNT